MEYPIHNLERSAWPPLLTEMTDPPKSLTARGDVAVREKVLAVVGTRNPSPYGTDATKLLIKGLRGYPITIVSGLALGIDAIAHEAALDAGLHTISVPGSGISDAVLYPARHKRLARRILEEGGGLLSEFAPDFRATQWSFPARNRIMAGMSHAVLVVEAKLRSGTLITSRLATEYNRDVLAVPGSIFSAGSEGPHMLISLGATPVSTSDDILRALDFTPMVEAPTVPELTDDERRLYELVATPTPRDQIAHALAVDASHASILVSLLELKGLIIESGTLIRRS